MQVNRAKERHKTQTFAFQPFGSDAHALDGGMHVTRHVNFRYDLDVQFGRPLQDVAVV